MALGEGPRIRLEDGEGTEISEGVKVEVGKEIEWLKEVGEIEVAGEENELLMKISGGGLKL